MAIYHLSASFLSRSKGHSGGAAAAYRAGEKVRSEELLFSTKAKHQEKLDQGIISPRFRKQLSEKGVELAGNARASKKANRWEIISGKTRYTVREEMVGRNKDRPELRIFAHGVHDYSRRGQVIDSEIHAPDGSPEWLYDRSELWTAHEAAARRGDGQVAQEVRVALPRELDLAQNKGLLRDFVDEKFVSKGMVADVSIHNDPQNHNPHAHILLTLREVEGKGFGKINRQWNDGRAGMRKRQLKEWRKSWEDHTNRHLEKAGSGERIDHRSFEDQGIDREPSKHMGKEATAMERQGRDTERGIENRMIEHRNGVQAYINANQLGREPDQATQRATLLARLKERAQAIMERMRTYRTRGITR